MTYTPADFANDLHDGIGEAYVSLIDMTEDPNEQIWPEYLVTVCVAQQLGRLRSDWGTVRLEEDVARRLGMRSENGPQLSSQRARRGGSTSSCSNAAAASCHDISSK